MTDHEIPEIFGGSRSLLITNVVADNRSVDIFIDEKGIIQGMGTNERKKHRGEADLVIDGDGAIALPGLVNTHTHAAMSLLRGYADDMILQDWLSQKIWPLEAHLTPADVYRGTRLACLEMIKSGTVAFNDMYFMMEEAARAVGEAGIRAVLSATGSSTSSAQRNGRPSAGPRRTSSATIRIAEQSPDQSSGRPPCDLYGLTRRSALVCGICSKGAEDRDPHPPLRDREGGRRLYRPARETPGRPSR